MVLYLQFFKQWESEYMQLLLIPYIAYRSWKFVYSLINETK